MLCVPAKTEATIAKERSGSQGASASASGAWQLVEAGLESSDAADGRTSNPDPAPAPAPTPEPAPAPAATPATGRRRRAGADLRAGNALAFEAYRQFVLDVPRMDIVLDGEPWSGNPTMLFMELWERLVPFHDRREAVDVLKLFSQTELLEWFVQGKERYCATDDEHFIDGGRQSIDVHFARSAGGFLGAASARSAAAGEPRRNGDRLAQVTIRKPFKVVDFNGDVPATRFCVDLVVTHHLLRPEPVPWASNKSSTRGGSQRVSQGLKYPRTRPAVSHAWMREVNGKPEWVYIE